jgi:hypothetical protein
MPYGVYGVCSELPSPVGNTSGLGWVVFNRGSLLFGFGSLDSSLVVLCGLVVFRSELMHSLILLCQKKKKKKKKKRTSIPWNRIGNLGPLPELALGCEHEEHSMAWNRTINVAMWHCGFVDLLYGLR